MNKNIPVGSLITTYNKGYFVLTRIEMRDGDSDLYHFIKVADSIGRPSKSKKEECCDEHWCQIADPLEIYNTEIQAAEKKYKTLKVYNQPDF